MTFIFLSLNYFTQDSVLQFPVPIFTKKEISLVKAKQSSTVHFVYPLICHWTLRSVIEFEHYEHNYGFFNVNEFLNEGERKNYLMFNFYLPSQYLTHFKIGELS